MSSEEKQEDGRKKKRPGLEEQTSIITQSAVTLFIEHGSKSVSIAQICSHANVSRPTFYRCFKDKDELIANIYQSSVNAHVENILLNGQAQNALNQGWLQSALDQLLEAIFAESQLARLVFVEANDPNSPASLIVDASFEHAADVMEHWLATYTDIKLSRVLLKSIMAASQWLVHDAIKKGLTEEAKQEAKDAVWLLATKTLSP